MTQQGTLAPCWSVILWMGMAGCGAAPSNQDVERRQAEQLYKPLLALVKESRASVEKFLETKFKRDYLFPTDRNLEGEELKLWLEQAEGDLMPRNERMCALVRAHADPGVDGPALTKQFQALLAHQDGWRALHEKWTKDKVAYNWHSPTPFPRLLQRELEDRLKVPPQD